MGQGSHGRGKSVKGQKGSGTKETPEFQVSSNLQKVPLDILALNMNSQKKFRLSSCKIRREILLKPWQYRSLLLFREVSRQIHGCS